MRKLWIIITVAIFLLSGCSNTINDEEHKAELTAKYPPYDFKQNPLVTMRFPSIDRMIQNAGSGVSFIITDEIKPMDPVTFRYQNNNDEAVTAIDGKLEAQGIAPDADIIIYPYSAEVKEVSGDTDISGKVIYFVSQYYCEVPKIKGTTGILVLSEENVPQIWIEQFEKAYPPEAVDAYVHLLHSELSYYYITDNNEVVPMSNTNKEEYDRLAGMKLSDFKKMLRNYARGCE